MHAGRTCQDLVVQCSETTAVVGATASTEGGSKDEIYVKYKCASAPNTAELYVLLYRDKYVC